MEILADHNLIGIRLQMEKRKILRRQRLRGRGVQKLLQNDAAGFLFVLREVAGMLSLLCKFFTDLRDGLYQFILVDGLGEIETDAVFHGFLRVLEVGVAA